MKATFNQKQKKTNAPTMQQRNRAFLETSSKHLEVMQQTFKKHDNVLQKIDTDYTNHTYTYTKYIHTNVHLPPGTLT